MMKNKQELKKYLKITVFALVIFAVLFFVLQKLEYENSIRHTNQKIMTILENVKQNYPEIKDEDLFDILRSDKGMDTEFADKFSIAIQKESLVKENEENHWKFQWINMVYFVISAATLVFLFLRYNAKKDRNIASIAKYVEEINKKNYLLDMDDMSEDELSILKNEIYKTTIMLKEQAENSRKDKVNLKDSLSDISHQLKTPLTAIMIRLDNLIDHPDMKPEIRDEFIREIKMETANISFLVQSILKLSKIDSDTVVYQKKDIRLSELVYQSVKRLLPLCDLKNITIQRNIKNDGVILCDEMWQVEAISNVIKNCLEYSKENESVDITIDRNGVYSSIQIRDYGVGIKKKDLNHIFDRFYKGEHSDANSIGIGLALSKSIIRKNNGTIDVESEEGKGTCFTIKYYQ